MSDPAAGNLVGTHTNTPKSPASEALYCAGSSTFGLLDCANYSPAAACFLTLKMLIYTKKKVLYVIVTVSSLDCFSLLCNYV